MRLSVFFPYQITDLRELRAAAAVAERLGYARLWTGNSLAIDTKLGMAAVAPRFKELAFGTAVSIMQLRHPLQAALEARSLAHITDGRFAYGLGVSERAVVEGGLGLAYRQPSGYGREYLTVVRQALESGSVSFHGEFFSVNAELQPLDSEDRVRPPLLLGALSRNMATVAGEVSDGAITWLVPPDYLRDSTIPAVATGAVSTGRIAPPVIALVPCVATTDAHLAHRVGAFAIATHITRPHYARVLRDAGLLREADPHAVTNELVDALVVWGSRSRIVERFELYREAGVSEVAVAAYLAGDEPARLFEQTLQEARTVGALSVG